MVSNLRDPRNPLLPWSFKDHEYQIGIVTCEASHIAVRKSSQVGVSELSGRLILGLMSLLQGTHWIYSLQTTSYARKFMTARLNPTIEHSKLLSRMRHSDADSTELKRIGDSFLYLVGAQKTGQAISIPCRGVIRDEIDFCNQTALTSLLSRLTHNDPGEEILQDFSTPTLPDYGIDKEFKKGTRSVYMAWHEVCGQWVVVDPAFDLVLPGFDDSLLVLSKADLEDPLIKPEGAWVKCRHCNREITRANLANPSFRSWVPEFPDMRTHSFYVSPLDVPKYNTPEKILRGITGYRRTDDWINFGLGHAHLPTGTAVSPSALDRATRGRTTQLSGYSHYGAVGGMDVGKTCHFVVMHEAGGQYVVDWLERIRQTIHADGTDEVSQRALEIIDQASLLKVVVDGGPDVTVPGRIIEGCLHHVAWASYFARQIKGLDNYTLDEVEQIITIARTAMIDDLVKDINAGRFVFPVDSPETELLLAHLRKLRKVRRVSETTGEEIAAWISSDSEDHYAFALLYAYTAMKLLDSQYAYRMVVPASQFVGRVKMQTR